MWKKLSSKTILEHPRLKVVEDEVELPNGHKTDYIRFEEGGNGATVIALNNDNKILLQKEYSYPPNEYLYQFPGGFIPSKENLEIGANRELMEESGLKSNRLQTLGFFYGNNRRSDWKMNVFLAQDLEEHSLPKDLEEDIEIFWFTEEEIDQMIRNNQIRNSTVLAAWSLYKSQKLLRFIPD